MYLGILLHVVGVAMAILLDGKLDKSSPQYSFEATLIYIFLLAIAFGLGGALCQATAFSCK